ncbi:3-alpha domain-containing protein [Bacillus sp. PSXD-155]
MLQINHVKFYDKYNQETLERVIEVEALSESLRILLLKRLCK